MLAVPALSLIILSRSPSPGPQTAPISIEVQLEHKGGWMPDGWGSFKLKVTNNTPSPLKLTKLSEVWQVKGVTQPGPWGNDLNVTIEAGKTFEETEIGSLPAAIYTAAKPEAPVIAGSVTASQDGKAIVVPFTLSVPGAFLPEPLKQINGKTVGLAVMASRYKTFKHPERALRWIDQSYQAMIDLTGEHPFNGERMVYKECPAHPWWAYAGKEMILNTDYVGETLKQFDEGLLSFGWVHEVGHNFDVLGGWYIWNGASAEFQANFKLAFAVTTIPDQSFRMKCNFQAPDYPAPNPDLHITGRELVDKFFLTFGDGYLADPKRDWTTMTSDETQTFFQRLQVVYGWDVYKAWYRTYRKLADSGQKPPTTPEDKVNLIAAILSHETHVDLVPLFQRWRFPVTEEKMRSIGDHYGIGK